VQSFEAARGAFKQGDYRKALEQVDKAIAGLPGDAVLHEFRALVHFALGNYRDAAATIYPVLAAGPGWDWQTMKSLYPDVKTYTEQLRALEAYHLSNPKSPEASFVLAYHYVTLGYPEPARKQLENVVALRPDDKLAAQLIQFLTQSRSDQPAPQP
jgi:tetratricopeptide (TPR) repeat protein